MTRLTQQTVKAALKRQGVAFKRTEYGEYRVCCYGHDEAAAYYTDDLQDALKTGVAMADSKLLNDIDCYLV